MADRKTIEKKLAEAKKNYEAFMRNAPSGMETINDKILKEYQSHLDIINDFYKIEEEMVDLATEADIFYKNKWIDAERSRSKGDLGSIISTREMVTMGGNSIPKNVKAKWDALKAKRDDMLLQVNAIKSKFESEKLEIERARFEAEKNYLTANDREYRALEKAVQDLEIELADLSRQALANHELKVIEKKSKQQNLKTLKKYSKNTGNVIKEAQKTLSQAKQAATRPTKSNGSWSGMKVSLNTDPYYVQQRNKQGKVRTVTQRRHDYITSQYKPEQILSGTRIGSLVSGKNFDGADPFYADFGTLFHRALEDYEKGLASFGLKNGTVSEAEVKKWLTSLVKSGKADDLADASVYTRSGSSMQQFIVNTMVENLQRYQAIKEAEGLMGKKAITEKALGGVLKIKGKEIPIAATADQIFGKLITDLKTSTSIGPEYVFQINLLRALAELNGLDVSKMKIFQLPRKGSSGKAINIGRMDQSDLESWIMIAAQRAGIADFGLSEDFMKTESARLLEGASALIGGGKYTYRQKDGDPLQVSSGLFRGKSLREWNSQWTKEKWTPAQIQKFVSSLSEEEQSHLKNLMFLRNGEGEFAYQGSALNQYRRKIRPEFYNKNGSAKTLDTLISDIHNSLADENGQYMPGKMVPSMLLGHFSATDIINLIATAPENKKKEIANAVAYAINRGLDSGSEKHKAHSQQFLKNLMNRSELPRGEYDTEKDKALDLLTAGILQNGGSAAEIMHGYNLFQTPEEMAVAAEYYSYLTDSEGARLAGTDEELLEILGNDKKKRHFQTFGNDPKKQLTHLKQLPHRISRMALVHKLYDQQIQKLYEGGANKTFNSIEEFRDAFLSYSPEMKSQYETSLKFANFLAEHPDVDIFTLLTDPKYLGDDEHAPLAQILGGDRMFPELANIINLVREIYNKNPELLTGTNIGTEKNPTTVAAELARQMGGRKEQYWAEMGAGNYLLAGLPLDRTLLDKSGEVLKRGELRGVKYNTRAEASKNLMALLAQAGSNMTEEEMLADNPLFYSSPLLKKIREKFENLYVGWADEHYMKNPDKDFKHGTLPRKNFMRSKMFKNFLATDPDVQEYLSQSAWFQNEYAPIRASAYDAAIASEQQELERRRKLAVEMEARREMQADAEYKNIKEKASSLDYQYTWNSEKTGEQAIIPSKEGEVKASIDTANIPSGGPLSIHTENLTINGSEISVYPTNVTISNLEGVTEGGGGGGSSGGSGKKDESLKEKTPEKIAKEQDSAAAKYEKLLTRQGELENMQQRAQNRYKQVGLTPSQQKSIEARYAYTQSELDEVQKKIDDFDYSTIDPAVKKQIDARNAAKRHVEQQEIAAERPANMFEQLTMSFKNYMRHWLSIGMMYQIMGKIKKAIGQVVQAANQLDKVMTNLRIVTNDNREEAMELMRSYSNLGQQLAATTTEVASAANDWLRQGYSVSEANDLITASLHLSKLGMIESGEATKYLTSMLKGFKLEAADAMSVVDKLTKVDMSAAASAGQIAESLRQFATTAQISGVNIDQAIAMATTIMDVSQRDASSVGAALKTMISRYGNVKAGAFNKLNLDSDSGGEGESLNDIEKVLKKIGISMRDTNLEFRDFDDVLEDLSEKWITLDNVSKSAVATAMAGVRQRESFLVLMENMDKYHDLIEISAEAEGTATEKYLSYQESLEASQKRLQAAWEGLAQNADINNFLTQITNLAAKLVKALPEIIRWTARIITMTSAWKLPKMLSTLGGKLGLQGLGSIFGGFGKVTGRGRSMTGAEYFSDKVNRYNPERTLGRIVGSISENVKALQDNTAALRGKKGSAASKGRKGPNLDENGNIVDSKGHYLGTDKDGNIAWLDKNGNPLKTKVSKDNERFYRELQKQRKNNVLKAGAASAVMGGLTGFMTAKTTHYDSKKNLVENSEEAMNAAQGIGAVTGVASGVASAFGPWGMAVGAAISVVGELLSNIVTHFIDSERDEREQRVKTAEQSLSVLQGVSASVESLKTLSEKTTWTADDYKKSQDEITKILNQLYSSEGSNARYLMEKFLGGGDLYDYLQKYLNGSNEQRESIANILEEVTALASIEAQRAANEKKLYELQERTKGKTIGERSGWNWTTLVPFWGLFEGQNRHIGGTSGANTIVDVSRSGQEAKDLIDYYQSAGFNVRAKKESLGDSLKRIALFGFGAGREYELDTSTMSLDQQEQKFEQMLAEAQKDGNTEVVESIKQQLSEIKAIRAETEKLNKELNLSIAQAAGLGAKYNGKDLVSLTQAQLKNLGYDQIVEIVAKQIEANGGLEGDYDVYDSNGNITSYAQSIIDSWMKQNSSFYGILTGQSYTLKDLRNLANGPTKDRYLQSFASAMDVSITELRKEIEEGQGKIIERYGKTTLGDWLKSPQETFEKLNNIGEVLASISQAQSLSAESIQNITNNYPELLRYIGKEDNLYKSIMESIESYSAIYGKQIFDTYITSAGYFDSIAEDIKARFIEIGGDYDKLIASGFGKASSVQDVITWATKNVNNMGKEILEILSEIMDNEFSVRTREKEFDLYSSTIVKYYEKQLENLNAQKEALEDINKQREYELKLMRAKIDLENAQKEKKRVWRDGVGWVYEADQSKIADAQKQLREAQTQKSISQLELEITELEAVKDYITNFKATEEYEAQMEALDTFITENGLSINATNQLTNAITDLYRYVETINLGDKLDQLIVSQAENQEAAEKELQKLWKNYKDADTAFRKNPNEGSLKARNDALTAYQTAYNQAVNDNLVSSSSYYTTDENGNQHYTEQNSSIFGSEESITTAANGSDVKLGYTYQWYDSDRKKTYTFGIPNTPGGMSSKGLNDLMGDMKAGRAYYWSVGNPHGGKITDAAQYSNLEAYARSHEDMIINGKRGKWEIVAIKNGEIYGLVDGVNAGKVPGTKGDQTGGAGFIKKMDIIDSHFLGTLGTRGGLSLINERGTEAIVTPGGTVTALPSATGIVPADITKNLWELGEIAPNIIQMMMGSGLSRLGRNNILANNIINGDSLNINTVNMTVNADDSFNVDKFVSEMKTAVALNKNNRH